MGVSLDYSRMLSEYVGPEHGISEEHLARLAESIERPDGFHDQFEALRRKNLLAFTALPYDEEILSQVHEMAGPVRAQFENFVILGIGGSALGASAIHAALTPPFYNLQASSSRGADSERSPRFFVCENIDPESLSSLFRLLDLKKTFFNVVSKSGSTTETMASFLYVQNLLEEVVGKDRWQSHFAVTTDPQNGDLRALSEKLGIQALPIPTDVGGRYSVLSAVGLLPAAVCGVDMKALLSGAQAMLQRCRERHLQKNPAYLTAALLFLAETKLKKCVTVMMPYSDALTPLAEWFCQLYAESLGKADSGMTPIACKGTTGQHSQLQLFLEGPNNKTTLFVTVAQFKEKVPLQTIPESLKDYANLSYLGGHSLQDIIHTEYEATQAALTYRSRPNMSLKLPELNAYSLGEVFMLFELAVAFSGLLYKVDPFTQPAVELGKKNTYHLLGRPGHETPPECWIANRGRGQKFII